MQVMPSRMLKAGEVVFRQGDAPDWLYMICYGSVEVTRTDAQGTTRVLGELGEGSVFGEMAILNTDTRNATVTAKTDCGLYTVSRDQFQHQVETLDPIMRGVFRMLVITVRDFLERESLPQEAQEVSKHSEPVLYKPDPNREIGGGLSSGEARMMQF